MYWRIDSGMQVSFHLVECFSFLFVGVFFFQFSSLLFLASLLFFISPPCAEKNRISATQGF